MSIISINSENLISSRGLATLVDRSSERIRQYEDEGLITSVTKSGKKYFDLAPSLPAIVRYIEKENQAQADILTAEQMQQADLRYKAARAGKMELELAELKGQMHRAEDVEAIVTDMIAQLRAMILALPGRLAVDTANATTPMETSAIIKKAVDELLNEMADYKYKASDYQKLVNEREKWLTVKEQSEQKQSKPKAKPKAVAAGSKTKRAKATSKTSAKTSKPRKTSQ